MTQHMPEARSSSAGLNLTDSVFERLLQERIVVLGSEVNDEVANRITAQLLLLDADDSESDITFYINSPGGSVPSGFAIYDTMQLIKADVATYAMGMAASMGQFLLSSGAPGKRYSLPHARILMHQPSSGISGTASDIAIQADLFNKWKIELAKITAEQTGQTVEQIIADGDRDRWFTAEEAKEYGFVDHVLSGDTRRNSAS
ncbi:ClpP family protease [Amycolatopsis nigrescens]|uniref:ClpP family protease n=1 Tax=Amycolatopsis nigrescens TaxID=381445 RepID=UPI0003A7B810|nr:ATP-dependent Clp protease proteolytic subunit [Amycolatopsis nigrescens]